MVNIREVIWQTSSKSYSCSVCGSHNIQLLVYQGTDQPNYVRVWRGQRVLTYRCLDCGNDFYMDEPPGGITKDMVGEDRLIDDEAALLQAEAELKKQIELDDDRRCL